MKTIFITLCLLCSLSACSGGVENSAARVLDNAGSVLESGSDKMITTPAPAGSGKVENTAGAVLDNAGSVVK
jgi:hypothetical protein